MTENFSNPDTPTTDLTANLTDRQLLETILNRLTSVEGRLKTVETYIAARPDTNPLWENIYKEVAETSQRLIAVETNVHELRTELRRHGHKLSELADGMLDTRADYRDLAARIAELEQRPS